MENENINTPVTENAPVPAESTQPAEPAQAPVIAPSEPAPINPPYPLYQGGEPTTTPESAQPTPPLEPSPVSSPAPILEPASSPIKNLLLRAKEKIQFRKRAKLEKIVMLAQSQGKITNNDIEKLLHISDATATRYLAELVKQGRLKRVGPAKQPFYELLDPEITADAGQASSG